VTHHPQHTSKPNGGASPRRIEIDCTSSAPALHQIAELRDAINALFDAAIVESKNPGDLEGLCELLDHGLSKLLRDKPFVDLMIDNPGKAGVIARIFKTLFVAGHVLPKSRKPKAALAARWDEPEQRAKDEAFKRASSDGAPARIVRKRLAAEGYELGERAIRKRRRNNKGA
jgi:hypothetical protein